MPFILPSATSVTAGAKVTMARSICLPSSAVSACAAPGNGMCSSVTPASEPNR
jgi:hypothetical protein